MAGEEKKGLTTGKAILIGSAAGVIAGGIESIIAWLTTAAKEAPPAGAVIFSPDEWTKNTFLGILSALSEISGKLDKQIDLLSTIAGVEAPSAPFKLDVIPIAALTIPGMTPKNLYVGPSPEKGAVIAIELVSNVGDIEYDIYLDDILWPFSVSDMVVRSIEYPHFPGAWLEKASGSMYVFLFSGGATSDVRYQTNLRIIAKATSASDVILSGMLVRKVLL